MSKNRNEVQEMEEGELGVKYLTHMSDFDMLDNTNLTQSGTDLSELVECIESLQRENNPIKMIRGISSFHKDFENKALMEEYALVCKLVRRGEYPASLLMRLFPQQLTSILNEPAIKIARHLVTKTGSRQNASTHKQLISRILIREGIQIYRELPTTQTLDELFAIIPSADRQISSFTGPDGKDRDLIFVRNNKAVVCELKYQPSEVEGGSQRQAILDMGVIHGKQWNTGRFLCIGLGIIDGMAWMTKSTRADYVRAREFENSMTFVQRVNDLLK